MAERAKASDTGAEPAEELLLFNIEQGAKVGSSYALIGVAKSLDEAIALLKRLPTASASKVAVLQRRAVLMRRPAVEVARLDEAALVAPEPTP